MPRRARFIEGYPSPAPDRVPPDRLRGTRTRKPQYIVGLFDEVEFDNQSKEEAARHPAYGPFRTWEEALAFAQTLSTDPNEATISELLPPSRKRVAKS